VARVSIEETVVVEEVAQLAGDGGTQPDACEHLRATQINVTITQAVFLGDGIVIQVERRRFRRVDDSQLLAQHLDLAGRQVRVLGAVRPAPHAPDNLQDELRTRSAVAKVCSVSGSKTTCTRPSRSRRSTKITPPWSRRR